MVKLIPGSVPHHPLNETLAIHTRTVYVYADLLVRSVINVLTSILLKQIVYNYFRNRNNNNVIILRLMCC